MMVAKATETCRWLIMHVKAYFISVRLLIHHLSKTKCEQLLATLRIYHELTSLCGVPTSVSKYFEKWRMSAKWIKNSDIKVDNCGLMKNKQCQILHYWCKALPHINMFMFNLYLYGKNINDKIIYSLRYQNLRGSHNKSCICPVIWKCCSTLS